ncbi:MAG: hypothetical protein OEM82_13375 [Acidobacteriota bacterium]|nr:hypothetical protein [Acidobacteriota bacterium]MDH3529386.1 hypothetical protein [Acidobacteriota bacterium]
MIKTVYYSILAIAAGVILITSFYAYSWLGSIGDPSIASEGYVFHSGFAWTFLWISFGALTLLSLFMTWRSGTKWAVCVSYFYFLASVVILLFNDSSYKSFLEENSITGADTLLNLFFVAVILLVNAVAVVAAYMIVINIRTKTPAKELETKKSATEKKE